TNGTKRTRLNPFSYRPLAHVLTHTAAGDSPLSLTGIQSRLAVPVLAACSDPYRITKHEPVFRPWPQLADRENLRIEGATRTSNRSPERIDTSNHARVRRWASRRRQARRAVIP